LTHKTIFEIHQIVKSNLLSFKGGATSCGYDILAVLLLLGINPVFFYFNHSLRAFSHDTFAYLSLADHILENGRLFVFPWGHIDTGLILPPLYPFLIALGKIFYQDILQVSQWVTALIMIFFSLPLFFYIKNTANRWIALIILPAIFFNSQYLYWALRPLTESFYMFFIGCLILCLSAVNRNWKSNHYGIPLMAGLVCGLGFLSRQIGILLFPFLTGFFLLFFLFPKEVSRKTVVKKYFWAFLGWLIILLPYSAAVYYQTGQQPLTQYFRMNQYQVKTNDPEVLKEIKNIEAIAENRYSTIIEKRRMLWKLLPDGSEMYGYVTSDPLGQNKLSLFQKFLHNSKHIYLLLENASRNFDHLKKTLGGFAYFLFWIFCLTPFFIKTASIDKISRLIIPSFIFFYTAVLSSLGGLVPRYTQILFPFALIQIATEAYFFFTFGMGLLRLKEYFAAGLLGILVFILLSNTPVPFTKLTTFPDTGIDYQTFKPLRAIINNEPVFCLTPDQSYLSGGQFRLMPNDTLEKVVMYAKKTRVRWLLVSLSPRNLSALHFYKNVDWYNFDLEKKSPEWFKCYGSTSDGSMKLFRFR